VLKVNLDCALSYVNENVPLFPCREDGSRAKAPYISNGFRGATANHERIEAWAVKYPAAIYGLPCAPTGLFVLDADRHGDGDGVANVMALFRNHGFDWQSVPAVHTPGKGMHFLFRRPAGLAKTKGQVAEAVDTRDNGYIIAPGNVLPDGRFYNLIGGTVEQLAYAIFHRTLPVMPDWLVAIASHSAPPSKTCAVGASAETTEVQLRGLVRTILSAPVGTRNRALFWAACRLGSHVANGAIGREAAVALLEEAGKHAGLGQREAYSTAMSGVRQGERDFAHEL